MKRIGMLAIAIFAAMIVVTAPAFAQSTFKIPYTFKVGTNSFPKGDYTIAAKDDTHLTLRNESTGKEFQVPFTGRLPQPKPPLADPQIVMDVVGNFAPSYTEYVTDYVLAEVWLPGSQGYQVHAMKGAHQTQTIKGQKTKH